jgi:uncharacterized damage-inducible protein DinB
VFDVELLGVKAAAAQPPAGSDLSLPLAELEAHITALAKAVPEEKYSWKPAEGVRSFQQVFLHIAYANQLLLNIAQNSSDADAEKKLSDEEEKKEAAPATKDQVVQALTDSFTAIHRMLDRARPNTLTRPADLFGKATTTNGVLIDLETHMAEHLGQAIAYARMNGIVPPWSK